MAEDTDLTLALALALALKRLREAGADRLLPVRWHFIETLGLRAEGAQGALQQVLLDKLGRAIAACSAALTPARERAARAQARRAQPSPLSGLLQHANAQAQPPDETGTAQASVPTRAPAELKSLREFRSTWARLSTGQQIQRSRAEVPDKPGPLNSHHLVLRTLDELQALSPAYLEHFVAHADGLLWIDQALGGGTLAPVYVVHKEGLRPVERRRPRPRRKAGDTA